MEFVLKLLLKGQSSLIYESDCAPTSGIFLFCVAIYGSASDRMQDRTK